MENQEPIRRRKKITGNDHPALGICVLIVGTLWLFWIEGCSEQTRKYFRQAEKAMVEVDDVSAVDAALDGKLIHASALADTKEVLTDKLFGASETAICLNRTVEYYQYVENTETDSDGDNSYTYSKIWASRPINSKNFHDLSYRNSNFVLVTIEHKTVYAKDVRFGGYRLPPFILESIGDGVPAAVKVSSDELSEWKKVIADNIQALGLSVQGNAPMVHMNGNMVYYGLSPSKPSIGDVCVTLTKIPPLQISIIAKVNGDTFEEYKTEDGFTISTVKQGTVNAKDMTTDDHFDITVLTWVFRVIGIVILLRAWAFLFYYSLAIFKPVPVLGNIIDEGPIFVGVVAGAVWTLLVMVIAWLWYHWWIIIALLTLVTVGIMMLHKKHKITISDE